MPQVVAAIAPIATNVLLGLGASLIANWLRPRQQVQTQTATTQRGLSFQVALGESVPVSAIFGRGRTAGHLVFAQEYGANNEYLKIVITMGKGWFDGLELALAEEKPLTLSGSNGDIDGKVVEQYRIDGAGAPSPTGTPHMWMKVYDGRPGQVADPGLIAASGGSGRWGSMHKATGTPYVIITLRYHANLFPSAALPRFGFVWRGLRLYDWRKDSTVPGGAGTHRWNDQSTWEWTENPAVIAWNYRRGYWINGIKVMGFGFSAWSNDLAYFTSAANISDEPIFYPATGATMARYAYGREVSDDEDRLTVQREIEASWCGSSFDRGGAYAPLPAAQQVPVMTLALGKRVDGTTTRKDRYGEVSAKKTAWHGTFMSQADYWVPTPFEQRINVDLEALVGGRKPVQFNQPYEHRQERAQSRAEINLRRNLFPATVSATFGPESKILEPGDAVTLRSEWGDTLMIVQSVAQAADDLGRELTLRQWSNLIVPASGEAFVTLPDGPGAGPSDPDRTIYVPSFDAIAYSRAGGGAIHPFGKASWSHISDPNVDQVLIRVWPATGDEAVDGETFFANPRLQDNKLFGPLQPDTAYLTKSIPVRKDGRLTFWSAEKAFVTGAETVPLPPGSITPEMLNQELRNTHGLVNDVTPGSLVDRIAELEVLSEQLAHALAQGDLSNRGEIKVLKAHRSGNAAAVLEERRARVEADAAMALLIQQVVAQLNNQYASAFIKFEVLASDEETFATIAMMVRVGSAGTLVESGIRLMVEIVAGVPKAQIALLTQNLVITDGTNSTNAITIDPTTGKLRLKELLFERIRSVDGVSIDINGLDPEVSLIGA
jgi:hypothetical protein